MASGCRKVNWIPSDLVKGFAFDQDGPCGSSQFVGQRGDHDTEWSSLQQPLNPRCLGTASDDCARTMHQQGSHIGISVFGYAQLSCLATGTCLARCEAQPRRELPGRHKAVHISGGRHQGGCCQWTDSGYSLQSLHVLVLLDRGAQPSLKLINVFFANLRYDATGLAHCPPTLWAMCLLPEPSQAHPECAATDSDAPRATQYRIHIEAHAVRWSA